MLEHSFHFKSTNSSSLLILSNSDSNIFLGSTVETVIFKLLIINGIKTTSML